MGKETENAWGDWPRNEEKENEYLVLSIVFVFTNYKYKGREKEREWKSSLKENKSDTEQIKGSKWMSKRKSKKWWVI